MRVGKGEEKRCVQVLGLTVSLTVCGLMVWGLEHKGRPYNTSLSLEIS